MQVPAVSFMCHSVVLAVSFEWWLVSLRCHQECHSSAVDAQHWCPTSLPYNHTSVTTTLPHHHPYSTSLHLSRPQYHTLPPPTPTESHSHSPYPRHHFPNHLACLSQHRLFSVTCNFKLADKLLSISYRQWRFLCLRHMMWRRLHTLNTKPSHTHAG